MSIEFLVNFRTLLTIVAASAGLLLLIVAQRRLGLTPRPRKLEAYDRLALQTGQVIESGSRLHISLGRGTLVGPAAPTSIAALAVLDRLAQESGVADTPPVVTVGEGTLLPAAQDALRRAYELAERPATYPGDVAQFIADPGAPLVYAAGAVVAGRIGQARSQVLVGRFGAELALLTAPGVRQRVEQIVGSDDPVGLAVAAPVADHLLIGEEILAAPAYVDGRLPQLASLQLQDVARWLLAGMILAYTLYQLAFG